MGEWATAEEKAKEQLGLVSRRQLLSLGCRPSAIKWALRSGRLGALYEGVYHFAIAEPTWYRRALGATLLREGGCALSHLSAGFLFRLDGVGDHPPDGVDLSLSGGGRLRVSGVTAHHPRLPFLTVHRGRFPVTSLARTLLDLAGVLTTRNLELALDSAHRRYHRLLPWLRETVGPLKTRQHAGLSTLRELIHARGPQRTEWIHDLRAALARRAPQLELLPRIMASY